MGCQERLNQGERSGRAELAWPDGKEPRTSALLVKRARYRRVHQAPGGRTDVAHYSTATPCTTVMREKLWITRRQDRAASRRAGTTTWPTRHVLADGWSSSFLKTGDSASRAESFRPPPSDEPSATAPALPLRHRRCGMAGRAGGDRGARHLPGEAIRRSAESGSPKSRHTNRPGLVDRRNFYSKPPRDTAIPQSRYHVATVHERSAASPAGRVRMPRPPRKRRLRSTPALSVPDRAPDMRSAAA